MNRCVTVARHNCAVGNLRNRATAVVHWKHFDATWRVIRLAAWTIGMGVTAMRAGGDPTSRWSWFIPTGLAVGSLISLVLLIPAAARRADRVQTWLKGALVAGLTFVGLTSSDPSFASSLFVGLGGVAWGIWRCQQILQDAHRVRERRLEELATARHAEVLAMRWTSSRSRHLVAGRRSRARSAR